MHPLSDFSINVSSAVSCTTHACPHHSEVTVPLSCHFSISSLSHICPHPRIAVAHWGVETLSITPIAVSVCCLITIWLSLKCALFMVSPMRSCSHKSRRPFLLAPSYKPLDSGLEATHLWIHVFLYDCFSILLPQLVPPFQCNCMVLSKA